ncbi:MAG: class I SAM-dependent methyltransferase [Gemmataceae bacterium]
MHQSSPQRFNSLAGNYRTSEVHRASPTVERLREIVPTVAAVCDVASGAGHTALAFADKASRIVAVDAAPNMLAQCRELAAEEGVKIETVQAFAEAIPLPTASFDLVVCRLAAHHFTEVAAAMREMSRLARPGGHVAIIDLEGNADPAIDALNHDIEMLHDPTHVRSYTSTRWREFFVAAGLEVVACEGRWREFPVGLTVLRWCELGRSGDEALRAIRERLAAAPAAWLAELDITQDADGEFRLPIRTLLVVGRTPAKHS